MMKEFFIKYKNETKKCINDLKHKNSRKKQIPNLLTASRMIAPIFIVPTILSGHLIGAGLLTFAFASTDAFDGYFARKYNAVSDFGSELDTVSDKIFAAGLIVPLIVIQPILLINLFLEAAIALVNIKSKIKGNNPKTILLGKMKTASLSLLLITLYVSLSKSVNMSIIKSLFISTTFLQSLASVKYYMIDHEKDNVKKNELLNIFEISNENVSEQELEKMNSIEISKKSEILTTENSNALQIKELIKLKETFIQNDSVEQKKLLLKKDNKN